MSATPATARDTSAANDAKTEPEKPKPRVQGIQYVWLVAHAVTAVLGVYLFISSLLLRKRLLVNYILYRVEFSIIAANYAFSLLKFLNGDSVRFPMLLSLDTMQFLLIATTWVFMPTHTFKLIPFICISVLHVLDCVQPKQAVALSKPLSEVIAWSTLLLFPQLLIDTLLIRRGGMISLMIYSVFYRIRIEFSRLDYDTMWKAWGIVDHRLSNKSTPQAIRGYWGRLKYKVENYETAIANSTRQQEAKEIREHNASL